MNKVYSRINWKNYPSTDTALNENNLNRMDKALDDLDNRAIEQDSTKAPIETVNNMVKDWTIDETTGVITVTKQNGSKIMFDLNIEKIPVSFELSNSGILTMTTSDGTQFTANIGSMIPILTFNESDQIAVSVSGSGVNKTYSFSIKDNSITENKLQPNFLADIKVQSANASLSANNAETSATQAQSYAIGGTGTRENEDTDNAMYYYEQAKQTDIGQISSKVDEINSKLSKQLGSHTVKSDVPENAVFTDTVYDDTEVKESLSKQSSEMMDIKMLGWSVPKECPVQNEVNGNQFVQKVGRADMSKLAWSTYSSSGIFRFASESGAEYTKYNIKQGSFAYLRDYNYVGNSESWSDISNYGNKTIMGVFVGGNDDGFILTNNSYTNSSDFKQAMKGKYLYYELATPITTTIDGNEIGETVSDVRKETTVNLLNPTKETITQDGITFTNNNDGTYTMNGTATQDVYDKLTALTLPKGKYKILGAPSSYRNHLYITKTNDLSYVKYSEEEFEVTDSSQEYATVLKSYKDSSYTNIVFKPMITTNLDATYNDFVPHTGDSGKLNSDVASLLKRIETLESLVNKTDTTAATVTE